MVNNRPIIFSTHPLHPDVTRALQELGAYRVASEPIPKAIVAESGGASIIVVRAQIPPEVVRRESGLIGLVRHGAGLDMIPVDVATECGVLVANVPGANARTVAEHAIWSASALLRRYPLVAADLRSEGWEAGRRHSDQGRELGGKTLGIVGLGAIGQQVARIAQAGFGMDVIAYTRTPDPDGIECVALPELLSRSDIVVLCCPLTEQTRGLLNKAAFDAMKTAAILVNVSRGPIVVESALLSALDSGHLSGAALDVFETQPLARDHPLLGWNNVILTPHMAGITEESMLRMGQGVAAHTRSILAGEAPKTLVNPDALPLFRKRRSQP